MQLRNTNEHKTEESETGIVVYTSDLEIIDANSGAVRMFGYEKGTLIGMSIGKLFASVGTDSEAPASLPCNGCFKAMGKRYDNEVFSMEVDIATFVTGRAPIHIAVFKDISPRFDCEKNLRHSEENFRLHLKQYENGILKQRAYFRNLFENSPQAIVLIDSGGKIIDINKGFETIFGYKIEDIKGRYNRYLVVPDDRIHEAESFRKMVLNGHTIRKETYRKHKNGRLIPVSLIGYPIHLNDRIEGVFYIYNDISEKKAYEEQLYRQSFLDSLTGIPNRLLFMERLGRALARSKRNSDYKFALLLADLDRFKAINDTLGHQAGDRLLIDMSKRFASCICPGDTVARLGGDEFAFLIEECRNPKDVIAIAKKINRIAQIPFHVDAHEVHTGASIGIVLKTAAYRQHEEILRDADIAMYRAKELGKARFKVFNKKMLEAAFEIVEIETGLRQSIRQRELCLFYQPLVSIKTRKLEGFEALVRWRHPNQGIISPAKFIPVAEETGLIIPMGKWIIEEACQRLNTWRNVIQDIEDIHINVNISLHQFMQKDFVDFVTEVLEDTELPPECLCLELTESILMKNSKTTAEKLRRLKTAGIKLAIDDFGTGYSALSYIRHFPVDILKIDRSFISNMEYSNENLKIVKTIITLAKSLDITVVAEGVETNNQLDILKWMDCDTAQGFLFSQPVNVETASSLIENLR